MKAQCLGTGASARRLDASRIWPVRSARRASSVVAPPGACSAGPRRDRRVLPRDDAARHHQEEEQPEEEMVPPLNPHRSPGTPGSARCGHADWRPLRHRSPRWRDESPGYPTPSRRRCRRAAPADRCMPAPGTERVLDQTVLARMITDHGQAAARARQREVRAMALGVRPVRHSRRSGAPGRSGRIAGPARGPSTARMALTIVARRERRASRRRTISPREPRARAHRHNRASTPQLVLAAWFSRSAAVGRRRPCACPAVAPGRNVKPRSS